jgi:hypothetical protein
MTMSTHIATPAWRAESKTLWRENSRVWGLCYYNKSYKWEGVDTYTERVPTYSHRIISSRLLWQEDA